MCLEPMASIFLSFVIITVINILAYAWAFKRQSDHLTDLSYSLCFIAVTLYFLFANDSLSAARVILALMVAVWGVRLGGFLFYRINKMGRDKRFDDFRSSRSGFLKFWLLQSLSISIIILPVLFGLLAEGLSVNIPAIMVWTAGWIMQSVADWQKFVFRSRNPADAFISHGLYKHIRHPNYTGEILIWVGIFWYVVPVLYRWQWVAALSPLWIIILLTSISGIPLIENINRKKYKDDPAYSNYLSRTWRLIPLIF